MCLPRPSDFYLVLASTSGCVPQPGETTPSRSTKPDNPRATLCNTSRWLKTPAINGGNPFTSPDPLTRLETLKAVIDYKRHSNSLANYLYFDGHVQTIPSEVVERWTETNWNFLYVGAAAYDD
jgi:prepilin-type processing-associated H-X9-DG protein